MRMTASWSGSKRTYRIQVCGAKMRPMASSPPMIMTQTPELRNEKPIALFIAPPRAPAFQPLGNTSDAKPARRQVPLAFRPLAPFRLLRDPDRPHRYEAPPF